MSDYKKLIREYRAHLVEAAERSKSERDRLLSKVVGYMEIDVENGKGFGCRGCDALDEKSFCQRDLVKAKVSAEHGCCNLFHPATAKVLFPPKE